MCLEFVLVVLLAFLLVGLWFLVRPQMRKREAKRMLTREPIYVLNTDSEKVNPHIHATARVPNQRGYPTPGYPICF